MTNFVKFLIYQGVFDKISQNLHSIHSKIQVGRKNGEIVRR